MSVASTIGSFIGGFAPDCLAEVVMISDSEIRWASLLRLRETRVRGWLFSLRDCIRMRIAIVHLWLILDTDRRILHSNRSHRITIIWKWTCIQLLLPMHGYLRTSSLNWSWTHQKITISLLDVLPTLVSAIVNSPDLIRL